MARVYEGEVFGDNLKSTTGFTNADGKKADILFTNVYEASVDPALPATITLNGRDLHAGELQFNV